MESLSSQYGLSPKVRYRSIGDEGVVVQLDSDQIIIVNELGLRILNALKQGASQESLVTDIEQNFEVGHAEASRDVAAFLGELAEHKLLVAPATAP